MNDIATSLTPSRDDGVERPSIDELGTAGSLHQRLAAARAAREKALARIGGQPEQLLSGPKPWERPEYLRGEPGMAQRNKPVRDRNAPTAAARPASFILSEPAAPAAAAAVAPDLDAVVARAHPNRQLWLLQVVGGATFGITIGIGLGHWFANTTPPDTAATFALTAEAPAAPGGDGATELAGIALPAADGLPATPDVPRLSNVTSLSAVLPTIATSGPLPRDATRAPQLAGAPQAGESVVSAPTLVAAPQPMGRGDLTLPAGQEDLRFGGLAAPGRVTILPLDGALNAPDAAMPALPATPDAVTIPAAWRMPDTAPLTFTPADTPLAAQDLPLPVSRPAPANGLTLILHAPAALADGEVGSAEDRLIAAGFGDAMLSPVDFTITQTNVRYFSPEDATAAKAVAEALDAKLRDFTSFVPRPPAGTVEIWLAGRGSGATKSAVKAAAKAPVKAKKPRPAKVSAVDALKNRLVRQLRAGTLN